METYLTIKVIAGIVAGAAHRLLVRGAREEGTGWWLAALFIPGAALLYGFQRRDEFGKTLLVKIAALAVVGGAFVMQVQARVTEAQRMAAEEAAQDVDDAQDSDEDDAPAAKPSSSPASRVAVVPSTAPAVVRPVETASTLAPPPASMAGAVADVPTESNFKRKLPGDLRERMAKLNQRRAAMSAELAKVDPQNPDAVRSFNIRVADYHEALARLQADLSSYQ